MKLTVVLQISNSPSSSRERYFTHCSSCFSTSGSWKITSCKCIKHPTFTRVSHSLSHCGGTSWLLSFSCPFGKFQSWHGLAIGCSWHPLCHDGYQAFYCMATVLILYIRCSHRSSPGSPSLQLRFVLCFRVLVYQLFRQPLIDKHDTLNDHNILCNYWIFLRTFDEIMTGEVSNFDRNFCPVYCHQ